MSRLINTFVAVAAFVFLSTPVSAELLHCSVTTQQACDPSGCEYSPPTDRSFNLRIDTSSNRYGRCDSKGCDWYDANTSVGGIYLNVIVPTNPVFARVSILDNSFTEAMVFHDVVVVKHGTCTTSE